MKSIQISKKYMMFYFLYTLNAIVFGEVARFPSIWEWAVVGAQWCIKEAAAVWAPSQGASQDGRARARAQRREQHAVRGVVCECV